MTVVRGISSSFIVLFCLHAQGCSSDTTPPEVMAGQWDVIWTQRNDEQCDQGLTYDFEPEIEMSRDGEVIWPDTFEMTVTVSTATDDSLSPIGVFSLDCAFDGYQPEGVDLSEYRAFYCWDSSTLNYVPDSSLEASYPVETSLLGAFDGLYGPDLLLVSFTEATFSLKINGACEGSDCLNSASETLSVGACLAESHVSGLWKGCGASADTCHI